MLWSVLLAAQLIGAADNPSPDAVAPQSGGPDGVSVADFGAAPDAVTDSTAAIQSAIDAVSRNPTHGRVRFPAGRGCYKVTAPLKIRTPSVRLEGENWSNYGAGTCLVASGFAGPMIHATVQAVDDLPFTTSLVAGPGRALVLSTATQDTATYIDLQDAAARRGAWPHGERHTDVINGVVDSLRLSSSARYTTTFTAPTTKLGFDTTTRLLENFDNETIDFSIVRTSFGPTYLPKNSGLRGLLGYLEISHLNLMIGPGIGMWLHGVMLSSFHHLGLAGGVFGISGREANFLNFFSDLHRGAPPATPSPCCPD
jgi:hypothetical protein